MIITELQALPGEKMKIHLIVKENSIKLPVTLIEGTQPGEPILITSGIHCTEYTGRQELKIISKGVQHERNNNNTRS